MRTFLKLAWLLFVFAAGCGFMAFHHRWPLVDAAKPKPPLVAEQPVVFS
jgi:hypothetical protein